MVLWWYDDVNHPVVLGSSSFKRRAPHPYRTNRDRTPVDLGDALSEFDSVVGGSDAAFVIKFPAQALRRTFNSVG